MIGDKDIDMAAAKAAGVPGVLFDARQNLDAVVAAALARR
jgi:phosphoglycolate phosphatase-like HAD superfamily hydrolase